MRLVEWIGPFVKRAGKTLWIVVDGGYTKAPFLNGAAAAGVTIVGRLRKDAALRDLPGKPRRDQSRRRGRPRKYGKHKISLAKRAGHKQGWQELACTIYGQTVAKTCKTFSRHLSFRGRRDSRGADFGRSMAGSLCSAPIPCHPAGDRRGVCQSG